MEQHRARQIAALRQHIPQAQCLMTDESRWSIQLVKPNMEPICTLLVELPAAFPQVAPRVHLPQPMSHAVIGADGVTVTHPKLTGWCANSNLGVVMREIAAELVKVPPTRGPPPGTAAVGAAAVSRADVSAIPVDGLSDARIAVLAAEPTALDDFLRETPSVAEILKVITDVREKNCGLATEILDMEKIVNEAVPGRSEAEELRKSVLRYRSSVESNPGVDKASVATALQTVASKADDSSADALEKFGDGQPLSDLKAAYLQARRDYHRATVVHERLTAGRS
jgi:hypothetical protein